MKTLTLLIATKNRREELKKSLQKSCFLLQDNRVQVIICDDGSRDGTSAFIGENYPQVQLLRNEVSRGIHFCRNLLFSQVKTRYAVTIDDDINFVEHFSLESITQYFETKPECAIMAFRIFWGENLPNNLETQDMPEQVQSFGAGGHAIDMEALYKIPKLPEWFIFYGEEDYMSLELFKNGKQVHYTPQILVHHRVDMKKRKKQADYYKRMKLSIRSGWYLYCMFYPKKVMRRKLIYSIYSKMRYRVLNGDIKVLVVLLSAGKDLLFNYEKVVDYTNRLTQKEYKEYSILPPAKIYWSPNKKH